MNPSDKLNPADWRESWAYLLGMQAYVYGFPAIHHTKLQNTKKKDPHP